MTTNKTETNNNLPHWIEDLFLFFLVNYENLWADSIEDDRARLVKKCLWRDMLINFPVEIIQRAAKEVLLTCPTYPPKVGEFHKVCQDLIAQDSRIKLKWSHEQPDLLEARRVVPTRMPESLRAKLGVKDRGGIPEAE